MYFTDRSKAIMRGLLRLNLPASPYCSVEDNGVQFQASTQALVRAIRAAFPGTFWKKEYRDECQWWQYDADVTVRIGFGRAVTFHVQIYAVKEAPPTCKAIVEKVMVEEEVPVAFEKRMVERERVRWDCGGDAA